MKVIVKLIFVLACTILPSTVHADYIVSSLTSASTSLSSWSSTAEGAADYWTSVGAGSVTSVRMCVGISSGTPSGVKVEIWSHSSDRPGSLISSSDAISPTSPNSWQTFTFSTPPSVTASTNYWVVLRGPASNVINNCGVASKLASYGTRYTTNSGSTWSGEQTWTQGYAIYVQESGGGGGDPEATTTAITASSTVSVLEAGDIVFLLGVLVFFNALIAMGFFMNSVKTYV